MKDYPREPRECDYCGTVFQARVAPTSIGRFCSRKCNGAGGRVIKLPTERFWDKVTKGDPCWIWNGATYGKLGYGYLNADRSGRTKVLATHVAWEIASGKPVPKGFVIGHACDNPSCVRNDQMGIYVIDGEECPLWGHLILCTQDQNMQDMREKNRAARGFSLPHTRISEKDIASIKNRARLGERQSAIARSFGIGAPHVSRILSGKRRRSP